MGDVRSQPLPFGTDTGASACRLSADAYSAAALAANFLDRPAAVADRMAPAQSPTAIQALTGDFS